MFHPTKPMFDPTKARVPSDRFPYLTRPNSVFDPTIERSQK
jgi:hypothetical protein